MTSQGVAGLLKSAAVRHEPKSIGPQVVLTTPPAGLTRTKGGSQRIELIVILTHPAEDAARAASLTDTPEP